MKKVNEVYRFTGAQDNMNFTITEAKTGFVFNFYFPDAPEFPHGFRALIPYGTWGFIKGMDMYELFSPICCFGSKFATYTLGSYSHEYKESDKCIKVLRHSYRV